MNLMYITNNPEIASYANSCGISRIFVDLEILGKYERQGHLDTVISNHSEEDINKVKTASGSSEVLVRINPSITTLAKKSIELLPRALISLCYLCFTQKKR